MALSNIGKEPRREITESVIGTLAAALFVAADYLIVTRVLGATDVVSKIFGTLIFGLVMLIVVPIFFFLTHALGEVVCDWMRALGADPRPRQRY